MTNVVPLLTRTFPSIKTSGGRSFTLMQKGTPYSTPYSAAVIEDRLEQMEKKMPLKKDISSLKLFEAL